MKTVSRSDVTLVSCKEDKEAILNEVFGDICKTKLDIYTVSPNWIKYFLGIVPIRYG